MLITCRAKPYHAQQTSSNKNQSLDELYLPQYDKQNQPVGFLGFKNASFSLGIHFQTLAPSSSWLTLLLCLQQWHETLSLSLYFGFGRNIMQQERPNFCYIFPLVFYVNTNKCNHYFLYYQATKMSFNQSTNHFLSLHV